MTEQRSEEFVVDIAASLDDVWEMLTTDRGVAAWYGEDAAVDLRPGGTYRVSWGDEVAETVVDAVEPLRRLRLVYDPDEPSGAEEWLLEHADGVTRVRLIHTLPDPGVDDWDEYYGDFRRGWRLFLACLRWVLDEASTPSRGVSARTVPAPNRAAGWAHVLDALGLDGTPEPGDTVPGIGTVRLVDAPHTLLIAGDDTSLLCDLEGAGDQLIIYAQAAIYGDDDAATRDRLLGLFAPAAG